MWFDVDSETCSLKYASRSKRTRTEAICETSWHSYVLLKDSAEDKLQLEPVYDEKELYFRGGVLGCGRVVV